MMPLLTSWLIALFLAGFLLSATGCTYQAGFYSRLCEKCDTLPPVEECPQPCEDE
jgi:hypothetical protein